MYDTIICGQYHDFKTLDRMEERRNSMAAHRTVMITMETFWVGVMGGREKMDFI